LEQAWPVWAFSAPACVLIDEIDKAGARAFRNKPKPTGFKCVLRPKFQELLRFGHLTPVTLSYNTRWTRKAIPACKGDNHL
jgi:hypothetical protein